MNHLSICEYRDIGSTARGSIPIPLEPPISEQKIDLGLTSQQSKQLHPDTCLVKLIANADCVIAIGDDPDASNSVRHLAAGREQIISVVAGSNLKIAAVAAGSSSMSDSLGAFLQVVANPAEAQKTLAALTKQATVIDTAAMNLRDATTTAAHGGTLSAWQADLAKREKALAAYDAKLRAKDAAIAAALS
jgi:hypothetical protein